MGFQPSFEEAWLEEEGEEDFFSEEEEATQLSSSAAMIELLTTLFQQPKAALLPCSSELCKLEATLTYFSTYFLLAMLILRSLLLPSSSNSSLNISMKNVFLLACSTECTLHQVLISQRLSLQMSPSMAKASQRVVQTVWSLTSSSQFLADSIQYLESRMKRMRMVKMMPMHLCRLSWYFTDLISSLQFGARVAGSSSFRNSESSFFIMREVSFSPLKRRVGSLLKGEFVIMVRSVSFEKAKFFSKCRQQFSYCGPLRKSAPLSLKDTLLSLRSTSSSSSSSYFCLNSVTSFLKCSLRMWQRRRQQNDLILALGPSPTMLTAVCGRKMCLMEGNNSFLCVWVEPSPSICMSWSNSSSISKLRMEFSSKVHFFLIYKIIPMAFTHYLKLFNSIFYMIRTLTPTLPTLTSEPFHDIINHPQDHPSHLPERDGLRKIESLHQDTDSSKENHTEDEDDPCHDKTIKKEHNKYESQAQSSKTIREQIQNILPQMDDNPEFDFLLADPTEVHRVLNCSTSFDETKALFLEESRKEKLNMCQNTDNFVTVKKGSLNSCKCIIKMWTSNQGDSTVYQLRCLNRENKRLKLIMIEGDEAKFNTFSLKFMKKLAASNVIQLTTREQIQIFFSENSATAQNINKQVTKLIVKGKKSKTINSQAECLIQKIKQECNRLKQHIKAIPELQFTLAYERQFQALFFKECGIFSLYSLIYKKDYEVYHRRREILLKKWNLFDIFKQLEISEHFDQYRKRRDLMRNAGKQFDTLPYIPAVKCLQQIKSLSSPSAVLEQVLIFQSKVKSCYNEYFINKLRVSDMDDYLPITIYCVLAMENEDNLLATTKMMLAYLSKEEEFEWEKKILTNLEAAFEFICSEWNVQQ